MAERVELYKRINSLAVPGFTHDQIQGIPAMPDNVPFKDGHLSAFSLVSVNGNMPEGTELLNGRLVQVTPAHGRSYEFRFGEKGSIYFADKYGNIFSSLTTKGNNLETPRIERDGNAPSGYRIYGMQDSNSMLRVLYASELLRSHNIDTEIILRVIEPQQLPLEGQLVQLQDFKRGLIQKFWDENRSERVNLPTITKALNDMTLFITVRGHQVPERMQDLSQVRTRDEFKSVMSRVFAYVNKASRTSFNVENNEDIQKYFEEYLPKKIAINYAKLHNLALIHIFPHQGNISAVGSIYDLDSVRGKTLGLGDEENNKEGFDAEIKRVCNETKQTITRLQGEGFIQGPREVSNHFEDCLYQTYFDERSKQDILSIFNELFEHHDSFSNLAEAERNEVYLKRLVEALGWDYIHQETIEQLVEEFPRYDEELIEGEIQKSLKNPGSEVAPEKIIEDGLIKSRKYTSHAAIDRFTNFILDRVEETVAKERKEELSRIEEKYGMETVVNILEVIADREHRKLSSQISIEQDEELDKQGQEREERIKKKYLDDPKEFYMNLLRENPQDYDPTKLVDVMSDLFECFDLEDEETMEALNLYLDRVCEIWGFSYTHPETFDQIKQAFFLDIELGARVVFQRELDTKQEYKDFEDLMSHVLGAAYESPWSSPAFSTYIHRRVQDAIEKAYTFLEERSKYGSIKYGDVVDTILMWIGYREQHRIYPCVSDEETEQHLDIEQTSAVLDERLKAEFLQRLQS